MRVKCRIAVAAILLCSLLLPASRADTYELPLSVEKWAHQFKMVPPSRSPTSHTLKWGDGLEFSAEGNVNEARTMLWSTRSDQPNLSSFGYLVVDYKARWLQRARNNHDLLVARVKDGTRLKSMPLVFANEVIDDGVWHRLIIKRPLPNHVVEFMVTLTSRDSRAEFALRRLMFTNVARELPVVAGADSSPSADIKPIDLSGQYNTSYDALVARLLDRPDDHVVQDGGRFFATSAACVEHIPFSLGPTTKNLVGPPPKSPKNDERITQFGLHVQRGQVAPISRDDETVVPVNTKASEVFLLLATEMPTLQKAYFIRETPKSLSDVESFAVELRYADGTSDLAFPYSLNDRRHVIQRSLAAYAVTTNGQMLKSVVLHNRSLHADVYLASLSLNTGSRRLYPQLVDTQPVASSVTAAPTPRTPFTKREGNLIHLGNSFVDLTADVLKGFAIRSLSNRWLGDNAVSLPGNPSLAISVGSVQLAPEEMSLADVRVRSGGFDLSYSSHNEKIPLDWTISISVSKSPEIRMQLTVNNHGKESVDAKIQFPVVTDLNIGESKDLFYMFPQYCNQLDSRPITLYAQAGRTFPMQFYDIFNPRLGGGVYLVTEDRSHNAQRYGLSKSEKGASFFVEYPAQYTHLNPGKPYTACPTVIGVHTGDWHAAAERYRKWVASWYRPYKSQDKQWYRESFWLLAEIADGLAPGTYKLPAWYDAEKKHFKMREILTEFERVAGRKPDILHFWSWAYSSEIECQRWGEYGGRDYDALGGLTAWRAALDDIQQNLKTPVSLYVNYTLCNRNTPIGQQLGPRCAIHQPDGKVPMPYPNSWRMCPATREWLDYLSQLYPRLARDTGAKILYVDETGSSAICYSKEHGHEVPLNCNKADYDLLKTVRQATPREIPLYGEFPNTDVNSQYSDCNINYYFLQSAQPLLSVLFDQQPSGDCLSPVPLNIYRYLFPRIAQLDLPLGMHDVSWHDLKFTFFHGEAIYDSYWDLDESKGHSFMVRAYDLKRQYKDCFTSDRPEMLVPTEQTGICANKFPGKGRTVWTLYNRRYTTSRGAVIAVDHVPGSKYRDAWHDQPLQPEIRNGKAILSLTLGPQEIGCLVQEK